MWHAQIVLKYSDGRSHCVRTPGTEDTLAIVGFMFSEPFTGHPYFPEATKRGTPVEKWGFPLGPDHGCHEDRRLRNGSLVEFLPMAGHHFKTSEFLHLNWI